MKVVVSIGTKSAVVKKVLVDLGVHGQQLVLIVLFPRGHEVLPSEVPLLHLTPSHIEEVDEDGRGPVEDIVLGSQDIVILTEGTTVPVFWAMAALAAQGGIVVRVPTKGGIVRMTPVVPATIPYEPTEEYDYGGD